MPDFDDQPFDDVSRAASDAATEPDFASLLTRGVRRRNRRRASYAGLAAVVLVGTIGAVQLAGGDQDSAPDPAPDPDEPAGLVFTRGDDSAFTPTKLTVGCQRVDGAMLVVVSGPFTEPAIDPEHSEPTIAGYVGLQMPLADVRDGAELVMPDPSGRPTWRLFVDDPMSDDEWSSREPHSSGVVHVESARCGSVPAIVFEADGVLGSESSDATVAMSGRVVLDGEQERPVPKRATEIIDHPDATLDSLAVSPQDPGVQVASWRLCDGVACEHPRWAVVVTGDGFRTRAVVSGVHQYAPVLDAAGHNLLVHAGDSLTPLLLATDGSTRQFAVGEASGAGPVIGIGSGLHLWTLFDVEHGVSQPLAPGGGGRADVERMNQIQRLADGSLAAFEHTEQGSQFARSTDNGSTWTRLPLDGPPGALYSVVDVPGSEPAVIEGADGATLFPLVAVHRLVGRDLVRTEVPGDPRAYVAGHAVLPDGRLLLSVESWSDDTAPGLYVTEADDWTDLSRVETGAPFGEGQFEARFLDVVYADQATSVYVPAPPSEETPAYRSDDGGRTWHPVPAR